VEGNENSGGAHKENENYVSRNSGGEMRKDNCKW